MFANCIAFCTRNRFIVICQCICGIHLVEIFCNFLNMHFEMKCTNNYSNITNQISTITLNFAAFASPFQSQVYYANYCKEWYKILLVLSVLLGYCKSFVYDNMLVWFSGGFLLCFIHFIIIGRSITKLYSSIMPFLS